MSDSQTASNVNKKAVNRMSVLKFGQHKLCILGQLTRKATLKMRTRKRKFDLKSPVRPTTLERIFPLGNTKILDTALENMT